MYSRNSFTSLRLITISTLLLALAILVMLGSTQPTHRAIAANSTDGDTQIIAKGGGGNDLACRKNNPERLDCSSLEVSGYCRADGVAVFVIHNTGEPGNGNMVAPTEYRIVDENGMVVASGPIQLAGGASMTVEWSGGGTVTLWADQQVGHPGSSQPRVTLSCQPETPKPDLSLTGACKNYTDFQGTYFLVVNSGAAMTSPVGYSVVDGDGNVLQAGSFQLAENGAPNFGNTFEVFLAGVYGPVTMTVDGGLSASSDCPKLE